MIEQELKHPAAGVVYFGYGPDFYVKIDIGESKLRWESTTLVDVDLPQKRHLNLAEAVEAFRAFEPSGQHPTPTEPGFYWARHSSWGRFEPVEMLSKFADFLVWTGGSNIPFPADAFVWGPRITLPDELEGVK